MRPRACMVYFTVFANHPVLYREAIALVEEGYEVEIYALRYDPAEPVRQESEGLSLRLIQARQGREGSFLAYAMALVTFFLKATVLLSLSSLRRRFEVVHVTSPPDGMVFCALLPKLQGARVILDIHDIGPEFFMRRLGKGEGSLPVRFLKLMERLSVRFADHVITVTELWRQRLARRGLPLDKCTVVINVPDHRLFPTPSLPPTPPQPPPRGSRPFRVVYHGLLDERAGVDTLAEAIPLILAGNSEIVVDVFGSGTLAPVLEALSRDPALEGRFRFNALVPFRSLPGLLAGTDLGIAPTKGSTFSDEVLAMKSLEFIALGIPIVASSNAGHSFYFDARMARFFPPGDAKALAEAVLSLSRDPAALVSMREAAGPFLSRWGWATHRADYLRVVRGDA